jgi:hypothetical protein
MKCGTDALKDFLGKHPAFAGSWKQTDVHSFTNTVSSSTAVHSLAATLLLSDIKELISKIILPQVMS